MPDPVVGFAEMADRTIERLRPKAPEVLFVDDDAPTLELGGIAFREIGAAVTLAASGSYALAEISTRMKSGQSQFDIIFIDIRMPEPDGMTILIYVRAVLPSTPIVMMSAEADPALIAEATKVSCVSFVYKPVTAELARQILQSHKLLPTK